MDDSSATGALFELLALRVHGNGALINLPSVLLQCGFFQRAHYKEKLPQYHAVKIPRGDRPQFQTEKSGKIHKKEWATHWSDGAS